VFRELREVALERFCRRVLENVDRFRQDDSRSFNERYSALHRWLQDRDEKIASAFNDPRRSRMLQQLAVIASLDLLVPDEMARFSNSTRETVELLSNLRG